MHMKFLKYITAALAVTAVITACSKEYSFEDPIGALNQGPILGSNCVINKITEFDTISNTGLGALALSYNAAGKVTSVVDYDSIAQNVLFSGAYTYNIDTIRLDPDQYFVVDASGRVIRFTGYEDPYDPLSDIMDFIYTYDASGKLIKRTMADPLLPLVIIAESNYTYTGNNLTGIVVKNPLFNVTLGDAVLEYQFDRVLKNYMPILPDCPELTPFIAGLNMGQKSLNPVKKITVREYDPLTGNVVATYVSEFKNYTYSRDGYVLSVDLGGIDLPSIPLSLGRNKFGYFCR